MAHAAPTTAPLPTQRKILFNDNFHVQLIFQLKINRYFQFTFLREIYILYNIVMCNCVGEGGGAWPGRDGGWWRCLTSAERKE